MPRSWRFHPHDQAAVERLSREAKVSPLLAQVLLARGMHESAEARHFLSAGLMDLHSPSLLPGVDDAADRVVSALESGRRITIYGDYDVDGVTSTTLLWHCLKLAGGTVDYYIPSRLEEGYGINSDALRGLAEEDSSRLLISVDCGIASLKEAALAKELGLELIITDHHNLADELPDAACLVHPRLPGSQYPFGELCGAGVAFKLAWAVCQRLGDGTKASPRMREFLMSAVGLAAVGTVADCVPLRDENRIIVRYGMKSIVDRASIGLKALMSAAGLSDKPQLESDDVAFSLGPRINAAGRLGQARLAVELLTTQDTERTMALAEYLNTLNKNRQTVERKILKQAKEQVAENPEWKDHPTLVLAHNDWHPGVIGIVASRVVELFEKPTVLISLLKEEFGQGSGRSFAGFDMHAGLGACSEHLIRYGGHKAAGGLKIEPDKIGDFRDAFAAYGSEHFTVTEADRELRIDAEVRLADVNHRSVRELAHLGPFGQGNPHPRFAATGVQLAAPPKKMGEGERHLSLRLRHYGKTMRAVAFGQADWADEIAASGESLSICFRPVINTFGGFDRVELHLIDWKPQEKPAIVG